MELKAFFIDSVDIDLLYGSGGVPLFKNAIQTQSHIFYFIGCSSNYKRNIWHSVKLFGKEINYFSFKE